MTGFVVGLAYGAFVMLAIAICRVAGRYDRALEEESGMDFMGKEKKVYETGWLSATSAIAAYIAEHFGTDEADGKRLALDVAEWAERELRGR